MKPFLLSTGGACLCVTLTIGLLLVGKSAISGRESASTPELQLETPDMSEMPALPDMNTDTGTDATMPDDPSDDAVPMTPSAPPSSPESITATPLTAPEPDQMREETVLRHPVAVSAGLVAFDGRMIQLDGLQPQAADRLCPSTTGTWPCGTVARTAFRNFIRARAFTCDTPKGGWTGTITARCMIGRDDPALWLARNGWAEADGAGPLDEAVEAARAASKGFFRPPSAPYPDMATPDGDTAGESGQN